MKKNQYILIILSVFYRNIFFAQQVSQVEAITVAHNVIQYECNYQPTLDTIIMVVENADTLVYEVNFINGESVILSGNKSCMPILGFILQDTFDTDSNARQYNNAIEENIVPLAYQDIIEYYANQIGYCFTHDIVDTAYRNMWTILLQLDTGNILREQSVAPLLETKWGQNSSNELLSVNRDGHAYNYYVNQQNSSCEGGYCPAGCVALAMAQIMRKWQFPIDNPNQSEQYDWYNMPEKLIRKNNDDYLIERDAVAKLIYDCAIGVGMIFCFNGDCSSGISTEDMWRVDRYLVNNCGYSSNISSEVRSNYPYNLWEQMLISDLNNGYPIFYTGVGFTGGHAFVCDGYKKRILFGGYKFHFNWGWKGKKDGWFTLNDLTPGTYDFSYGQQAIFHIYPSNCWQNIYFPSRIFYWWHNKIYYAGYNIKNNNQFIVNYGAKVHLRAGCEIELKNGFFAMEGSDFEAKIAPCNTYREEYATSLQSETYYPIEDIEESSIVVSQDKPMHIYPNPTDGTFYIKLENVDESIKQVYVNNILGKEMLRKNNLHNNEAIDISALPAGLYVVRVLTLNGKTHYGKLVKE